VSRLCALLGVTRAGYYAWRSRGESAHLEQDRTLSEQIRGIFEEHHGRYGSPRVQLELARRGLCVSRRRVERLMREAGLRARVARLYRSNPRLHQFYGQHPNRLWRKRAKRTNQFWVGDVTYLPIAGRWRFLAVVMDQYSRRVLGWSLGPVRNTQLTRAAFDGAIRRRAPRHGLIFHSDRGTEYAGTTFRDRLRSLGVRQSMTRGGSPGENAHMESFFHSLKADVVHGVAFTNDTQLRECLSTYVQYYNHKRMHSSLGYRSPVEYERGVA
jgi:putative transposase